MQNRLIVLRDRLRDSYWFIPAILSLAAIILSFATVAIDHSVMGSLGTFLGWNFAGSPEGVRTLLSTIAGSMITVVGLVFSLTMVVLTLASQQYGPLIVSNFVRDRQNQFVLGIFTATFLYCMLVLRTVRGGENEIFVPQLSSLVSMVLAVLSLAVLIYFIHHIGYSIRSHTIISSISQNLLEAIDDLFPGQIGHQPDDHSADNLLPADYEAQSQVVLSQESGYLQLVNERQLMHLAEKENLIIELRFRPGEFVVGGSILGRYYPRAAAEKEIHIVHQINDALYTGGHRTPAQDVELLFGQLVSIALRALSPALNDPYTAVMCIDRLGEGLSHLAKRPIPSRYRKDETGKLRIVANPITFASMVHLSFDEIRHYGARDLMIVAHLLRILKLVGESLHDTNDEAVLHQYAYDVWHESQEHFSSDYARTVLNQKYQAAVKTLTN